MNWIGLCRPELFCELSRELMRTAHQSNRFISDRNRLLYFRPAIPIIVYRHHMVYIGIQPERPAFLRSTLDELNHLERQETSARALGCVQERPEKPPVVSKLSVPQSH